MKSRRFPYQVVVECDHHKWARTFRAYSPRHALNLAEQVMRAPDWKASWRMLAPVVSNAEGRS